MIEGMVSTIISVYNRIAMLREVVSSVLAQSWRRMDIIFIDWTSRSWAGRSEGARALVAIGASHHAGASITGPARGVTIAGPARQSLEPQCLVGTWMLTPGKVSLLVADIDGQVTLERKNCNATTD